MASKKQPKLSRVDLPRVRMIDIAREAGVSQPAVSYVLNGRGEAKGIADKTAERIRAIAKRLNFQPNLAAQQLAGKRSGVVAVLAGDFFHAPQVRAFSRLSHLCNSRGLEALGRESASQPFNMDDYVNKCIARNVEGLIFLTLDRDKLRPQDAKALARLPHVISLFDNPCIPGGHCVDFDSVEGVRQAVAYLHGQGRRKIVQILESLDTMMNRRRCQGFLKSHAELGRPVSDDQICVATKGWDFDKYPEYAALLDELVDRRGADAIIADNDYTASALAKAIQRRGLRMPDDVALVGWGNEIVSRWLNPSLTTVDYRIQEMMTAALDLLIDLIERPGEDGAQTIRIKPELLIRESA